MDRQLRRAPDAEWVLMYRLGLSRKCIAELVRDEPATVGYHLVIARRQDPGLEAAHLAAAGTKSGLAGLTHPMAGASGWLRHDLPASMSLSHLVGPSKNSLESFCLAVDWRTTMYS
jgi:hypothetical protein